MKVIATSTHRPAALRQTGRVLPDLLRRLVKRHVRIPSLAERGRGDIAALCKSILGRIARREGKPARTLSEKALAALCRPKQWAENISDLIQTLEAARRKCGAGKTIRLSHLPALIATGADPDSGQTLDAVISRAKRRAIAAALDETNGDVKLAAEKLGRSEKGLYRLIKDLKVR